MSEPIVLYSYGALEVDPALVGVIKQEIFDQYAALAVKAIAENADE